MENKAALLDLTKELRRYQTVRILLQVLWLFWFLAVIVTLFQNDHPFAILTFFGVGIFTIVANAVALYYSLASMDLEQFTASSTYSDARFLSATLGGSLLLLYRYAPLTPLSGLTVGSLITILLLVGFYGAWCYQRRRLTQDLLYMAFARYGRGVHTAENGEFNQSYTIDNNYIPQETTRTRNERLKTTIFMGVLLVLPALAAFLPIAL